MKMHGQNHIKNSFSSCNWIYCVAIVIFKIQTNFILLHQICFYSAPHLHGAVLLKYLVCSTSFSISFFLLVLLFTLLFRLFPTAHYLYVFTLVLVSKVAPFVCVMFTGFLFFFTSRYIYYTESPLILVLSLRFYLCVPYIFFNNAQGDSKFRTRSS